MGFYEAQLVVLGLFCAASLLLEKYASNPKQIGTTDGENSGSGWKLSKGESPGYKGLMHKYLTVYAIVMGADWLQGPYVYSLYHEQYVFSEKIIAILFVTGFTSAGVFAPLVGVWADQHGRKRLCLYFCLSYAGACLCMLIPKLPILLMGRVLGGLSTSILFSCFESWLMGSSSSLGVSQSELSNIMGRATLLNGFIATAAGVVSNELVARTSNFLSPFMASALLLGLAWLVIRKMWDENFGGDQHEAGAEGLFQLGRLKKAWSIVGSDTALLTLGFTQTCFEGSMYLFVFLWVPSLQEASPLHVPLPLGYIFSSFMISMMLGSLGYTCIVANLPSGSDNLPRSNGHSKSKETQQDSRLVVHAKLSSLVCAMAALALALAVRSENEHVRFWAFCLFEGCVGMYYPVQGMLRGALIPEDHRATLSSLFRVPLNVFVTVSLLTGVSSARKLVFTGCALVLSLSSLCTGLVVVRRAISGELKFSYGGTNGDFRSA
ncbi:DUF791-domain-containing protein [Sistotremastrum suecicum HHB10207 ss-3]|uniref:Molybdate-anion transporter n=1 Tax=Sistotremastrum suecicum HHB10207 ss-3 TaxID=1314776 RepID=A0A166I9C8_9AGAM|nr:DUF791-domain-containing protein [Sistotremastrum suecicum HHB10207 ss-3]